MCKKGVVSTSCKPLQDTELVSVANQSLEGGLGKEMGGRI